MKENLTELMIQATANLQYAAHVRTRIQTWLNMSFRFNSWFLDVAKSMFDKEPLSTLLSKDSDAFKTLKAAFKSYRSSPDKKTRRNYSQLSMNLSRPCMRLCQRMTGGRRRDETDACFIYVGGHCRRAAQTVGMAREILRLEKC